MKIRDFELFKLAPRFLFLKITTDNGIEGWGEPIVEGRADTVAAAVKEAMEPLIGQDPRRIEDACQIMYRGPFYRGGPVLMSAMSGIEQALWDIKGKALGVPVHELLGGACRDRLRVYSWIGGDTPEAYAKAATEKVAAGFTALKMCLTEAAGWLTTSPAQIANAVDRVAAARAAVGPTIDLAVDFHGRVHRATAKVLAKALEPYGIFFIEEPVLPEHLDKLAEIARVTHIPIATGERCFGRTGFKALFEQGVVDIIQPDLSHAGGIWEVRKIAAMAEAYDVAMAPHCPLGPLAFAASLQVDAVSPNFLIQEQAFNVHQPMHNPVLALLKDPGVFKFHDGFVPVPMGPGLGVEVDEAAVRAAANQGHNWHAPLWRLPDGSLSEW